MPKISIIVTAYFPESKPYLDLCIQSINNLSTWVWEAGAEVIIVGRPDYMPQYEGVKTVSPPLEKFYPPVGLNYGISQASKDSEYFFVLNDDTILTRTSLSILAAVAEANPQIGVLMPMGNDQQSRYVADCGIRPGPKKLDDLSPIVEQLMDQKSVYPYLLSFHETLCIYAFLTSRKAFEHIGPFDEGLHNNDDIDYTLRATQLGYKNAICYQSIVYHFGGVSADHTFDKKTREEGLRLFNAKWHG